MAFNIQSWCRVSSSSNNSIVTLQSGAFIGAPNLFSYISASDTQAVIGAANYFSPVVVDLNVGDLIYAVDSGNTPNEYIVTAKNNDAKTVTVADASVAGGDVVGPAVATDNALVRFDGATGKLIQNGVVLESDLGDLTSVRTIQNGIGSSALPSYTFGVNTDTGMYWKGANEIGFSTQGRIGFAINSGSIAAVNYLQAQNSITLGNPKINCLGTDDDVGLTIQPKGIGIVYISGTATAAAELSLGNQNNTESFSITADNLTSTDTYQWPSEAPTTDGQVMTSTAAGIMSWQQPQKSSWIIQAVNLNPMVANTYYLANGAADVTFTMPATASVGDMFQVVGMNAAFGWIIQMNAGQTALRLDGAAGNATSVAGTITWNAANAEHYSSCLLVCTVADTTFVQIAGAGNPIFA